NRIMCFEVRDAIRWLFRVLPAPRLRQAGLQHTPDIDEPRDTLRLADINTDDPDGARIHESAGKVLAKLGTPDADTVTLDQIRRIKAGIEALPVSEIGVVLPEASDDAEVRAFLADIIAHVGGAQHAGGKLGVNQAELDEFLTEARAYLDWLARSEIPDGQSKTDIMPLGAATPEAYALLASLAPKIDQYFAQCQAIAFDARIAGQVGLSEAELAETDFDDPASIDEALKSAPLAGVQADGKLPLKPPLNPYYVQAVAAFRTQAVAPALGRSASSIDRDDWREIQQFFAAHRAWVQADAGAEVSSLGPDTLRAYLDGSCEAVVRDLIAESTATALELDSIRQTERLILYRCHLLELANNFISFPRLYDVERRAMFEMGTLIMDGRRFNLAVKVANRAAHAALAKNSSMFVLYVEVGSKAGKKLYDLAVPVTSGGKGNLQVGKRGVFIDINGLEWDARVVSIIDNPISIREALVSPFKRLGRMLSGKIESITSKAEKTFDAKATAAMTKVEQAA
ncbi:hypothetical protein LCGC14_2460070, partial [marine sediment metagenome]